MVLQWARKAAHNGKRVGFWTLEMTQDEVFDRIVASISPDLTSGWARGRKLSDHDFAQAYSARDYLADLPLGICADGAVTVPHIRLAAMKAKAQGKPYELIVVDYLQLLSSAQGEHHDNEAVRVSRISRALKLLAKELDIPIVVLCQLNREIEHGNGRRPRLADLRDSGAIEQDADAVVFIHRAYDANKPQTHGELVIAKNRHGMLRAIPIDFDGAHMRFVQLTLETDSPYGGAPSSKPHQQPVL
jgi:replicative DNA helicase